MQLHTSNPSSHLSFMTQVCNYNYDMPGFRETTGHFTQLVWVSTRYVGCAIAGERGAEARAGCRFLERQGTWLTLNRKGLRHGFLQRPGTRFIVHPPTALSTTTLS